MFEQFARGSSLAVYLNEGLEMDAAVERANAIFSALDINNDGDVTEEEFVRGCMEVRRCW